MPFRHSIASLHRTVRRPFAFRRILTRIRHKASNVISSEHSSALPGGKTDDLHVRLAELEKEISTIYAVLYETAQDNDRAAGFAARRTVAAFGHQWANLTDGKFMLSDPKFRAEVDRIITQQELLIDPAWFPGKRALDAGCGGGRWSYGLAKLGAHVTAVDTNPSALAATRAALNELGADAEFVLSPLEDIDGKLPAESFDLVWSWGVLHHCTSFMTSLKGISSLLKPGGLLHLYLYGRESIGLPDDLRLFRERMRYNFLPTEDDKQKFLREKSVGHGLDIHHVHDIYAPLVNRRFEFQEIKGILEALGFTAIERTIDHTELWIRAVKGHDDEVIRRYAIAKHRPPYWFERVT